MTYDPIVRDLDAIALDVDGTIADTDPIHASAWAQALYEVTGQGFDVQDYLAACIDGAMSPRHFISNYTTSAQWPPVEREKRRLYPAMLRARASPTTGFLVFLEQAQRAKVHVVVVSSSSRESVDAMLSALWPAQQPDAIVARQDGLAPKPDPSPYQLALELVGTDADRTVAFEDSPSGVAAARAAGLMCVQVGPHASTSAPRIVDFSACSIARTDDRATLRLTPC